MILAQATTHANSLYHEWGLIAAAGGLCVPLLGGVAWLLKQKSEEITECSLRIRTGLAGLLERTFHTEALRVFELIDDHLPFALSQVDAKNPRPSAFDMLCLGLREINPDEPDRDRYRSLLKLALSGIISTEARKLLGGATPTGLRFSFRHETERILAYIAEQTTRSRKKERAYDKATCWAKRFLIAALIAASVGSIWVMFDTTWAFYLNAVCLSAFLGAVVAACVSFLVVLECQTWIGTRVGWQVDDWLDDLDRSRQKWRNV